MLGNRWIIDAKAYAPEKGNAFITKSELAVMIVKLLEDRNFKPEEYKQTRVFADVKPGDPEAIYIGYCVDHGIMPPKSQTMFEPEGFITFTDYCRILLNMLGYADDKDVLTRAQNLGLFAGVNRLPGPDEAVGRFTALPILINAVFAPSPRISGRGPLTSIADKMLYMPVRPNIVNISYIPDCRNPKHMLDMYYPETPMPAGGYPTLVLIHGGGFARGDKFGNRGVYGLYQALEHGFAIATINYRLTNEAYAPAQIVDAKAAVRFLKANAPGLHINPQQLVPVGLSSGGNLSGLLAVSADNAAFVKELTDMNAWDGSDRVAAAVCLYGVFDYNHSYLQSLWLAGMPNAEYDVKYARYRDIRDAFSATQDLATYNPYDPNWKYALLGHKSLAEAADLVRMINPAGYAAPDNAPLLLLHGEADATVAFLQSVDLYEALQNAGAPVELILVPNADHGRDFDAVYDLNEMFLWIKNTLGI